MSEWLCAWLGLAAVAAAVACVAAARGLPRVACDHVASRTTPTTLFIKRPPLWRAACPPPFLPLSLSTEDEPLAGLRISWRHFGVLFAKNPTSSSFRSSWKVSGNNLPISFFRKRPSAGLLGASVSCHSKETRVVSGEVGWLLRCALPHVVHAYLPQQGDDDS